MKLNIQIRKIRNDLYIASCTDLIGCHVQGNSKEEAISRIKEAIKLMIISYKKHFEKVPIES